MRPSRGTQPRSALRTSVTGFHKDEVPPKTGNNDETISENALSVSVTAYFVDHVKQRQPVRREPKRWCALWFGGRKETARGAGCFFRSASDMGRSPDSEKSEDSTALCGTIEVERPSADSSYRLALDLDEKRDEKNGQAYSIDASNAPDEDFCTPPRPGAIERKPLTLDICLPKVYGYSCCIKDRTPYVNAAKHLKVAGRHRKDLRTVGGELMDGEEQRDFGLVADGTSARPIVLTAVSRLMDSLLKHTPDDWTNVLHNHHKVGVSSRLNVMYQLQQTILSNQCYRPKGHALCYQSCGITL